MGFPGERWGRREASLLEGAESWVPGPRDLSRRGSAHSPVPSPEQGSMTRLKKGHKQSTGRQNTV